MKCCGLIRLGVSIPILGPASVVSQQQGHVVDIHKADPTTETHRFTVEHGAILPDPEVQKYFPGSESGR